MGMGRGGGPPMPLPPTEVEEPYRLSQLGTQPLLVPVQVTIHLCWHAACSRSLRWEWVVVEAPQCHYHQQRLKNPIDYPSWVPNLCWYQFRSLSTSVGMRYAVDL